MFSHKYKVGLTLAVAGLIGSIETYARPSVSSKPRLPLLAKTAANCREAQSSIDLDINNVRARMMTGGDMWWDRGTNTAAYEVPKGSKKSSLFAGSCWIGGYDAQGQLKVAAQLYRSDGNDYWPGPLDQGNNVDASTCSDWDRFWKVNRADINRFRELIANGGNVDDPAFDDIKQWPARGAGGQYGNRDAVGTSGAPLGPTMVAGREYAPFVDMNGDGNYNWRDGDYPDIFGDQYIWWVFNDKGNLKGQTKSDPIGLEVQTSAFAYTTKDFLNDASFVNYRIINRGALTMDSTFMGTWTDADLGLYQDDYIGCDTARGLGILYNAKSEDGNGGVGQYGNIVPMIGVDFFRGPKRPIFEPDGSITFEQLRMTSFTYFNNAATSDISDPTNGVEIFNYMTGTNRVGKHFRYDFQGPGIASSAYDPGPEVSYVYWGEPNIKNSWSECSCNNPSGDRRFVHSGGPFKLLPGAANDITIGAIWVSDVGGCPNTSFQKIRTADDMAQELFDANFQIIEGPQAPRLVIREMDRKLICYIINDPTSNNFGEQYGYNLDSAKYRVPSTKAAKVVKSADSLYKFEGYRVFQVKNSETQPADIYDAATGEVNADVAVEVFQCDIRNGIARIDNYVKNTRVSDTTWTPQVKVEGKDSGIVHSFELSVDEFSTTDEKRLVNYKSYYYIAVAYAYNNFAPFDVQRDDSTQDIAYLESRTAAGGSAIPIVVAMPNPANGDMGTVVNAGYGDGVIIHRLEGKGNGDNPIQLNKTTEDAIMASQAGSNSVLELVYDQGNGPVDVKVVDPVRLQPGEWELYMQGPSQLIGGPTDSIIAANQSSWFIVKDGIDTIYSERKISTSPNEQILEKYGLSINIAQVSRAGEDQNDNNGLLTSDAVFADPNKPWLTGVADQEGVDIRNWIRSGSFITGTDPLPKFGCSYDDNGNDTAQAYEKLLDNNTYLQGTWAPYGVVNVGENPQQPGKDICNNFALGFYGSQTTIGNLHSVNVYITSDKSKWSRCVVVESQSQPQLSENFTQQFRPRSHASWTGNVDGNGNPVYSTTPGDTGMSWFPGYAIDQVTGKRLAIMFGEDSYLRNENGADMIWNPTSSTVNYYPDPSFPSALFGGKHYTYVSSYGYELTDSLRGLLGSNTLLRRAAAFNTMMWVGIPLLNSGYSLLPLKDNLIPTDVTLRFKVKYPYGPTPDAQNVVKAGQPGSNNGFPHYKFSTTDLAPTPLTDGSDKNALLDRIHVVPNPYYGYTGYEANRLDTRVRIINLPKVASIDIYSLDGSLVRRLTKDNANASYIDWDIRNAKGLPVASGMYLFHVRAEGIGETVVKWFGAMRPLDVTSY